MFKHSSIVFKGLQIIAWIIFVGICIEAAALLVNFIFGFIRPDLLSRLYEKLDLTDLYAENKPAYIGIYSFIISLSALKAYLFYAIISLMRNFDLENPFQMKTSKQILNLCYTTLSIGLISYIGQKTVSSLPLNHFETSRISHFWVDTEAFLLTSAIIYVLSYIYYRGVEIQHENDLTV